MVSITHNETVTEAEKHAPEQLILFAPDTTCSLQEAVKVLPEERSQRDEAGNANLTHSPEAPPPEEEWQADGDDGSPPRETFFTFPPQKLRESLERCVTYMIQHEGQSHTDEFWQLLCLLCTKLYEERTPGIGLQRFQANRTEFSTQEGVSEVHHRISDVFNEAKHAYPNAFLGREHLSLQPRTVAYIASELGKHTLSATEIDPFSVVYQQWATVASRSFRGQFFSPMIAARFAIEMLAPQEGERLLDYTCGAGAFIAALYAYHAERLGITFTDGHPTTTFKGRSCEDLLAQLHRYMQTAVFGADIDGFLVEVAKVQMALAGSDPEHIYRLDSLAYPHGNREDNRALTELPPGSLDCIIGNPPFDAFINLEASVRQRYELAHRWREKGDGEFEREEKLAKRVSLASLFLERALTWLRPGGRLALIVPESILGNPSEQYVRAWLLTNAQVLAVVSLPIETFQAESGTHTHTSLLLARKLTESERASKFSYSSYSIFMAVCEHVGIDSRGRPVYKRDKTGEFLERHDKPIIDNDLPIIARKYRRFLQTQSKHVVVHLPAAQAHTFERVVETTFGLRVSEILGDGMTEETHLLCYTISTNPPEGEKRFFEFLSQQKQARLLENFASLRNWQGDFLVGVNPENGHLIQILLPRKPGEEVLVIDLNLFEEGQQVDPATGSTDSPGRGR